MKKRFRQIRYYIYIQLDNLKQVSWNDIILIDKKALLAFLLFFILNLLFNKRYIEFPSSFSSIENCINIIETLIRSVVVLLSIIFSFTLLSFQIHNKYFGRFAFYDFFKKSHFRLMFTLFILNVFFLIYTVSYLRSCSEAKEFDTYGKLLFVESITFSVLLAFSIFPVMINLLSSAQSRINLKNLFSKIDDNNVFDSSGFLDQEISELDYEINPFKIISEISITSIKDYDHTTFEIIIKMIYNEIVVTSNSEKSESIKTACYGQFIRILRELFDFAIKEKNGFALLRIVTIRFLIEKQVMHLSFLKDNNEMYKGWDYGFDVEAYYDKAIQGGEESIGSEIVSSYNNFIGEWIKNKFPENFLYDFDKPYQNIDYTTIVNGFYMIIERFMISASKGKKYSIVNKVSNLLSTIDIYIVESKNSTATKSYLLQVNNIYKEKFIDHLVEDAGVRNIEFSNYPFGIATTSELTSMKSGIILSGKLKSIDYLFNKNILNNMVLNDIKATAFSLINNFEKDAVTSIKYLELIFKKISYIKSLIKDTDSDDRKAIYIQLKRYLSYLENDVLTKVTDEDLKRHFKELIDSFNFYEQFDSELKSKGYILNLNLF